MFWKLRHAHHSFIKIKNKEDIRFKNYKPKEIWDLYFKSLIVKKRSDLDSDIKIDINKIHNIISEEELVSWDIMMEKGDVPQIVFRSYFVGNRQVEEKYSAKFHYLNGILHREFGPAIEWLNGSQEWYKNGKLHREGGPAINGQKHKEWWINGRLHKVDGPALEIYNSNLNGWLREWRVDGRLHRHKECAVEKPCGTKEWYINGILHREDGPAIIWGDKYNFSNKNQWWLNGVQYRTEEELKNALDGKIKKNTIVNSIPSTRNNLSGIEVVSGGRRFVI